MLRNNEATLKHSNKSDRNRPRFISDMIELFLWLLILSFLMYPYVPNITLFSLFDSSNPPSNTSQLQFSESIIQEKSPEYRMQVTMQVVLGKGEDEISRIFLDSLESTQIVLTTEFLKSQSKSSVKLYNQNNNSTNNPRNDTLELESIRIKCIAPFPILFLYEGNGDPKFDKISLAKRNVHILENSSQDFYIATLDFGNKVFLEESDTGRYICEHIDNRNPPIDKVLKINDILVSKEKMKQKVAIKLFVPGERELINRKYFPNTSSGSDLDIRIDDNAKVDDKAITVPCGVSDPKLNVNLYRKEKQCLYPLEAESEDAPITYDSIDGFQVPLSIITNWTEITLVCRVQHGDFIKDISFRINLRQLKFHIAPASSHVTLHRDTLPVQVFRCEAAEPVEIKWSNSLPTQVAYGLSSKRNEEVHSATFIATPNQFSSVLSSVAEFQCIRKRDGGIVHAWNWVRDKRKALELYFNEIRNEWFCCGNHNYSSHIFVEPCSSILECTLAASMLKKQLQDLHENEGNRPFGNISKGNQDCHVWAQREEFLAGVIMCAHPHTAVGAISPPILAFFSRWNDNMVVFREGHSSKPFEEMISMRVTNDTPIKTDAPNDISKSEEIHKRIICTVSSMVFAKGFKWKFFTWNDQVHENVQLPSNWKHRYGNARVVSYREEYLQQTASYQGVMEIRITRRHTIPLLKIRPNENGNGGVANLELHKTEIRKISCEAPLWNDTDHWTTSSLILNENFLR